VPPPILAGSWTTRKSTGHVQEKPDGINREQSESKGFINLAGWREAASVIGEIPRSEDCDYSLLCAGTKQSSARELSGPYVDAARREPIRVP
jgi:hypothetical protein